MRIVACCCTYNRPQLLGRMIECFLRQTHEDRFLVVLDDARQYPEQEGERWHLYSWPERFPCLSKKRNIAAELANNHGAEAMAVWDDDDLYLPWALEALDHTLYLSAWAQPSEVLEFAGPERFVHAEENRLTRHRTYRSKHPRYRFYHASWAYRTTAFYLTGGYRGEGVGEDLRLREALLACYGEAGDPMQLFYDPYYVYGRGPMAISDGPDHQGQDRYAARGQEEITRMERIPIGWDQDYAALPIPKGVYPFPWENR